MSEFHRMITYLYLYEQGMKSRNIGFAKVEKRGQQCLLEIHMKNTGCSLSPVPVYFYVQKGSQLAGIPLGNFGLTRGSGDFKTVLEAANLKDSGYGMDDVKGIFIPLTAQMMLVSQWDDDEFNWESFVDLSDMEAEQPTSSKIAADNTSAKTSSKDSVKAAAANGISTTAQQEIHTKAAPRTAAPSSSQQTPNPTTAPRTAAPSSSQQTPKPTTAPRTAAPSSSQQTPNPITAPRTTAPSSSQQTPNPTTANRTTEPSSVQKSAEQTPVQQAAEQTPVQQAASAQQAETPVSQQDEGHSPSTPTDALKAAEALPRSAEETPGFRTISKKRTQNSNQHPRHSQTSDNSQRPEHSQADAPENWDLRWRFILENYPVMTPFAGDENTLCVRMELKDLRQLPKQFWYLGNNSFLLHGFFNYRYFVLGMTEEFGVRKWFIGVPGVFQNPERVMAALFGFPEFRSEKPSTINTGEFGYWYRYLNELSEPAKQ